MRKTTAQSKVEGRKRIRRFAVVLVAEATDAEALRGGLCRELKAATSTAWVSDPCPIGPAETYEVTEIRMAADGDLAVTGPGG